MKQINISELAEADLADIWFYIAQDNIEAADRFVSLILKKCKTLVSSPGMGIERPELAPSIRSFPVGNYIIFYRQDKHGIEIARVLSGRRDIRSLIE